MRKNHKWNGSQKGQVKATSNNGGLAVSCVKCGCVLEYVAGIPTYFIDDTVYDRHAPSCDERLITPTPSTPRS